MATYQAPELENCPFCGKNDFRIASETINRKEGEKVFYVQCENCACHGPLNNHPHYETAIQMAKDDWNKCAILRQEHIDNECEKCEE